MKHEPLPSGPFGAILADPPWAFQNWSDAKNGAARSQYPCMSVEEIAALPVAGSAATDAFLFLWCPWAKVLEDVHRVVAAAWGFRLATVGFLWNKTYADGSPYCGMGFYTRGATEVCFLGVRGKPRRESAGVFQVITAPRVERHSRKPEATYERIEEFCVGPYLELFARPPHRPGWSVWGNETIAARKAMTSRISAEISEILS